MATPTPITNTINNTNPHPYLIVATSGNPTTKPNPSTTATTTNTIQTLCPYTGSILTTSTSSTSGLTLPSSTGSIHSFHPLPLLTSPPTPPIYTTYTSTTSSPTDTGEISLLTPNPAHRWRCRAPERMDGGILPSPCGRYLVGGGRSGSCYIWSTFGDDGEGAAGGTLERVWKAHYRSVTALAFTDCGGYVVTGGGDGVVGLWSLLGLVEEEGGGAVEAVRTWSEHLLPVTSLYSLPSSTSRIVSTGVDQAVVLMEGFSGRTLARMNVGVHAAIQCATSDPEGRRLYLGGGDAVIYCIDIDLYAIANTAESATILGAAAGGTHHHPLTNGGGPVSSSSLTHVSELTGHHRAVTCLAFVEADTGTAALEDLLVSGSEDGSVRVWDIRSRCCVRIIHPWTSSSSLPLHDDGGDSSKSTSGDGRTTTDTKNATSYPCSTLTVLRRDAITGGGGGGCVLGNMFGSGGRTSKQKGVATLASLVRPLQRFPKTKTPSERLNHHDDDQYDGPYEEYVHCIVHPKRDTTICGTTPSSLLSSSSCLFEPAGSLVQYTDAMYNRKYPSTSAYTTSTSTATKKKTKTIPTHAIPSATTEESYSNKRLRTEETQRHDEDRLQQRSVVESSNTATNTTTTALSSPSPSSSNTKSTTTSSNAVTLPSSTDIALTECEVVQKLRQDLDDAKDAIARWQKVNNKLLKKLKRASPA